MFSHLLSDFAALIIRASSRWWASTSVLFSIYIVKIINRIIELERMTVVALAVILSSSETLYDDYVRV